MRVSLSGGHHLEDTLTDIDDGQTALCISDTRPFGRILGMFEGEELFIVMKVVMAHIKNPNFILRCGRFKGMTLLQGAIATGNNDVVQLVLSNTHGSKISKVKEPVIIDAESAK